MPPMPDLNVDDPRRLAEVMKVLADRSRLQILSILASRPDATGSEMVPLVGVRQSVVSHHLTRLRRMGLVSCSYDQQSVPYRLEPDALAQVADAVRALRQPGTRGAE